MMKLWIFLFLDQKNNNKQTSSTWSRGMSLKAATDQANEKKAVKVPVSKRPDRLRLKLAPKTISANGSEKN